MTPQQVRRKRTEISHLASQRQSLQLLQTQSSQALEVLEREIRLLEKEKKKWCDDDGLWMRRRSAEMRGMEEGRRDQTVQHYALMNGGLLLEEWVGELTTTADDVVGGADEEDGGDEADVEKENVSSADLDDDSEHVEKFSSPKPIQSSSDPAPIVASPSRGFSSTTPAAAFNHSPPTTSPPPPGPPHSDASHSTSGLLQEATSLTRGMFGLVSMNAVAGASAAQKGEWREVKRLVDEMKEALGSGDLKALLAQAVEYESWWGGGE
ncbi:unnamed protein product [Zymoseptoria tritici ST99CH_1E4]|uniref:Uncharacterized protein n=1 Tax=Zymoseptoria tritici ST99CH_1E4 TaxID=1276532 RepID=A0A2H1H968_ZYMTR|nr:unnamed protein product [Zymoseptoria tritici ST99CH_1E4]